MKIYATICRNNERLSCYCGHAITATDLPQVKESRGAGASTCCRSTDGSLLVDPDGREEQVRKLLAYLFLSGNNTSLPASISLQEEVSHDRRIGSFRRCIAAWTYQICKATHGNESQKCGLIKVGLVQEGTGNCDSVLQINNMDSRRGGGGNQHARVVIFSFCWHLDCGGVFASQGPLSEVLRQSLWLL